MIYNPAEAEAAASQAQGLQPRLIKGMSVDYEQVRWPGSNTSGLKVYGKNVLVRMDPCSEASAGGIMLTDDLVERMTEASVSGCIYALGPEAFRLFDDGLRWDGDKPKVGERVYVEKYAGVKARGVDGAFYRIMDYRCIAAGLADDAEAVEA